MLNAVILDRTSESNRYGIFIHGKSAPSVIVYPEKREDGIYRIMVANPSDNGVRNPARRGECTESELAERVLECARRHAEELVKLMPGKPKLVDKTLTS